jgi:hypothetical protein
MCFKLGTSPYVLADLFPSAIPKKVVGLDALLFGAAIPNSQLPSPNPRAERALAGPGWHLFGHCTGAYLASVLEVIMRPAASLHQPQRPDADSTLPLQSGVSDWKPTPLWGISNRLAEHATPFQLAEARRIRRDEPEKAARTPLHRLRAGGAQRVKAFSPCVVISFRYPPLYGGMLAPIVGGLLRARLAHHPHSALRNPVGASAGGSTTRMR